MFVKPSEGWLMSSVIFAVLCGREHQVHSGTFSLFTFYLVQLDHFFGTISNVCTHFSVNEK